MKSRMMRVVSMIAALVVASCGAPVPTITPASALTQSKQENPTVTPAPPPQQSPTATAIPPTRTSLPLTLAPTSAPLEAYWPTKGWRTSTPEEQGMDSAMLVKLADTTLSIHHL